MPLAPYIDGFEFAALGGRRTGTWAVADLPRLRERLATLDGELRFQIDGVSDGQGRPALHLVVTGILHLTCQRCLESSEFEVNLDSVLALARSQAAIDMHPVDVDGPDWIVASKSMAIGELIEDELLLDVPLAPMHEGCSERDVTQGAAGDSPFAELKGMMRKRNLPPN